MTPESVLDGNTKRVEGESGRVPDTEFIRMIVILRQIAGKHSPEKAREVAQENLNFVIQDMLDHGWTVPRIRTEEFLLSHPELPGDKDVRWVLERVYQIVEDGSVDALEEIVARIKNVAGRPLRTDRVVQRFVDGFDARELGPDYKKKRKNHNFNL